MTSASAPRLLHEVFARSARQHPSRVAVDVPPSEARPSRVTRTYAEIDADASRVSACLWADHAERVVAVLLGRHDPWLYACQLGIQRAGAAWVGLDARHPDEALRFLLEDASVREAFSDTAGAARLRGLGVPGLVVHDVGELPGGSSRPDFAGVDERLAYVIYTSGTTGRPKGVLIEHRSAVALILGDVEEFGLGPADRVAQGSSPAYDSSVEEVWLAWAVGGTVVPLDDVVIRSGPDLLPWLRNERITVLCPPPTLLRTLGARDPERDLPDLRLLYVGGEALDQDLADQWARGRRMVNGYGPTECTVTVTRADVVPGQVVTIGRAVPGSRALVLDEELRPVTAGDEGELCIAGMSLARGYLGRPELTDERFVQHLAHGRIYRTGDLVRLDPNGCLVFGGRRDTQVKLRGHRVELGEIDARLLGRRGITAAASVVGSDGVLRAFVVGAAAGGTAGLRDELSAELPSHMVPVSIESIDALPTTVGGKLDRRALEARGAAGAAVSVAPDRPLDGVEGAVGRAFAAALGRAGGVGLDEDFFEAGGDSVRAATLVSALRECGDTASLTVRDVYEARTVRGLAERAKHARVSAATPTVGPAVDRRWRAPVVLAQTLWVAVEAALAIVLLHFGLFGLLPAWLDLVGATPGLLLLPVVGVVARVLWWGPAVLLAALTKRALLGRYRPGRWSVRGWFFFRHWVVVRVARLIPHALVQGTELQCVTLRLLGARVGRGVHLARGVDVASGGWDLLDVGEDAVVERDGALELTALDAGEIVIGPVTVGRRAVVGVRAGVGSGAVLGEGAEVTALSRVCAGDSVRSGETWAGVPARCVGAAGRDRGEPSGRALGLWTHAFGSVLARSVGAAVSPMGTMCGLLGLGALFGVSAGDVTTFVRAPELTAGLWLGLALCLALVTPAALTLRALALRLGPKCRSGVHPLRSAHQILADERMRSVESAGVWLSGTLFWPAWLRLAGARIGRASEVSTIMDVLPEQLTIGGRSFFADGIYLGGPRRRPGLFEVGPVAVGERTFLGNHVVVPCGARLPDGVLVGVSTLADPSSIRAESAWFGHPAFELPRREVVTMDEDLTFSPGPLRVINRLFWELSRFGIPGFGALLALDWIEAVGGDVGITGIAASSLQWASALVLSILGLKWFLLGRVRPGQHGLWSCWCSRWDFLYVAWGMLARPVLARFDGTPWLAFYLRAMGLRIGRGAVLGPGFAQVVDPDMIDIGDGATVDTMFQAHSFEDRVLKIDRVRIGDGATVGRASVLLYGIDIGAGARVAAHSVVMKRERLLPGRRYVGVPTREVDA